MTISSWPLQTQSGTFPIIWAASSNGGSTGNHLPVTRALGLPVLPLGCYWSPVFLFNFSFDLFYVKKLPAPRQGRCSPWVLKSDLAHAWHTDHVWYEACCPWGRLSTGRTIPLGFVEKGQQELNGMPGPAHGADEPPSSWPLRMAVLEAWDLGNGHRWQKQTSMLSLGELEVGSSRTPVQSRARRFSGQVQEKVSLGEGVLDSDLPGFAVQPAANTNLPAYSRHHFWMTCL